MFNQLALWLKDLSQIKLFISLVMYATCVALLFQLVALPYFFPEMHAGNGLIVNGDWVNFHNIAVGKYDKILAQGWSAWELRPRGQFPPGIASVFYVLIYPEPWSLIPLNAMVWAASGILVMRLVMIFIDNRGYAIMVATPFLFLPSAAMWYTQLLKDGFYTFGLLLLLYSGIRIVESSKNVFSFKNSAYNLLAIAVSIVLIWIVRPYSIYFASILIVFTGGLILMQMLKIMFSHRHLTMGYYASLVSIFLAFILVTYIAGLSDSNKHITIYNEVVNNPAQYKDANFKKIDAEKLIRSNWRAPEWMPKFVENKLLILSVIRAKYININPDAESNIKGDEYLFGVDEMIDFVPRAIQIVYTEPSPADWVRRIGDDSATFFYKISIFEMMVTYIGLFFFAIAIWLWRTRWEIWLIATFTGGFLLVHGIVIPNIGTLYRMRYGMLMLIVTIGLAALVKFIHDKQHPSDPL